MYDILFCTMYFYILFVILYDISCNSTQYTTTVFIQYKIVTVTNKNLLVFVNFFLGIICKSIFFSLLFYLFTTIFNFSNRKRLRKSSTGSGSGSTERTSEEHPNEAILPSPGGSTITHIKVDPGFTSESSTPQRTSKQPSSDSDLQRESSQESIEGEHPHQITLVS